MYFENKVNVIHPCDDLQIIAEKFYSGTFQGNGYQYKDFIFVDDRFCEQSTLEVAVVNQKEGFQVESITVGWIKSAERVLKSFEQAIKDNTRHYALKVPMCEADLVNKILSFECGCCGNSFQDTFKNQEVFGQDAGYGICNDCKKYYL